jgi:hypothetical protein
MFIDDLITILTTAGVGTFNVNIFASSKAQIPTGAGPYLSITQTSGSGPENTHNAAGIGRIAYERPNAQLLARAQTYPAALGMIDAAFKAVFPVRNRFVNGVWWRQVVCLQQPFDFGLDDLNRICFVFNIAVTKRPDSFIL